MSKQDYCIVPTCKNTSCNNPSKIFIKLPIDRNKRYLWLEAIGRTSDYSSKSCLFVCEDHFNLEQDMENFLEFKMMGVRKRMKPDAVPHLALKGENNAKISPNFAQPPNTFLGYAKLNITSIPDNKTLDISVSSKTATQTRDLAIYINSSSGYKSKKEKKSLLKAPHEETLNKCSQTLPQPDILLTPMDTGRDWKPAQITIPHRKSLKLKTVIPKDYPKVTKKEPRKRRKMVKKITAPENRQLKIIKEESLSPEIIIKEESLSPEHMECFEEIYVKEQHELAN